MDRNSVIGFVLIGIILIGYSYMMQPSEAELARMQEKRDSIAQAQELAAEKQAERDQATAKTQTATNTQTATFNEVPSADSIPQEVKDSLASEKLKSKYGMFSPSASGEQTYFVLENEKIRVRISNKGGQIISAQLKEFQTYDSLPVYVVQDSTRFNLNFFSAENRLINTDELFFEEVELRSISADDSETLILRANTSVPNKFIEYQYSLAADAYDVGFAIRLEGMQEEIRSNAGEIALNWKATPPAKEKDLESERNVSTVYYKFKDDEVDYISERSYEQEKLEAGLKWVSFKQQFFSSALISETGFENVNADVETREIQDRNRLKLFIANLTLFFEQSPTSVNNLTWYFGPNHYQTLASYDVELEKQINLGWGIFGWVNRFVVIPVFNFLDNFNLNYGIIILILTVLVKLVISPLTFKTYISSAKMKVLKPEIDELNEKHKNSDAMKKQQATMALYREAGVNPMAGCVPMLLQMPILIAMFNFFPASFELRQSAFLWADDLSTYDSVLQLPFEIPFYGSHVSLFTILLAVSMFLYTKYNTQMTMTSGPQAAQMKIMTYMMPFMMLFFFNSYSAGLSYYYFTSNILSVIQQLVIKRFFIDEDKIHAKIQANKKRPKNQKKSGFQKRLEEMAKKRGIDNPYDTSRRSRRNK